MHFAGLIDSLRADIGGLEALHVFMDDCLNIKRMQFPRFAFLGDAELLELLSEPADYAVAAVQRCINSMFSGIGQLEVAASDKGEEIVAILSIEGERVPLTKPVKVRTCCRHMLLYSRTDSTAQLSCTAVLPMGCVQALQICSLVTCRSMVGSRSGLASWS